MKRGLVAYGLGYGDEGKGTIVDYLCRSEEAKVVIRFNGGPQAAHRVVAPDGREHVFAQFGSGTLVDGVRTHLGPGMLVNPFNAFNEEEHLRELGIDDSFQRLTVDPSCAVITPYQIAANRIRELARGHAAHGSCGQGVGETRWDEITHGPGGVLRAGHLAASHKTLQMLKLIRERKLAEIDGLLEKRKDGTTAEIEAERGVFFDPQVIAACVETYRTFATVARVADEGVLRTIDGAFVFEGSQGVLLDERFGFYPYTTWTDTTGIGVWPLLNSIGIRAEDSRWIGIVRAYSTRHGPGPFVAEAPELRNHLPDDQNKTGRWQKNFRVGYFDMVALEYALRVCAGVDEIALTCLDRIENLEDWQICEAYRDRGIVRGGRELFTTSRTDDRRVTTIIPPGTDTDATSWMGRITNRLLIDLEPILRPFPTDPDGYRRLFEEWFDLPVTIESYGPSAEDKETRRMASLLG